MTALRTPWRAGVLLLLLALALRWWDFGNPVIHVDEQYYLLVGDAMLHGAVPYIDIWDRKPIGLFLLFAAIRLLPGDGILAYQLVATLFAAATAAIVWASARRLRAAPVGALTAAAAYLVWLSLLGGRGGQSPVFYNLFVAAAGLLTLRLPGLGTRAIFWNGIAACALAGIAIQMKYVPVFEGLFFGCAHLWFLRRTRTSPFVLVASGLAWAATGALPTLAALAWYAAHGAVAFHAFWFANITSIALRPAYPADQIAMRLLGIAAQLAPLGLAAALAWRWRQRDEDGTVAIAFAWLMAASAGFLVIGTYFDHYALPLLAPLALCAAPALGRSARLRVAALGLALTLFVIERAVQHDDAPGARAVAAFVRAHSAGGCPYVFIGDTITYRLADSCLPTAYAFPNLLAYTTEQGATGINEAAEVRRILARRPPVIVTSTRKLAIWNRASLVALKAALARDYRLGFSTPRAGYRTLVYVRRQPAAE